MNWNCSCSYNTTTQVHVKTREGENKMKINKNKCSIFIDGATIDYNQLKDKLTENIILKKQIEIVETTFKNEGGIA